jgi:hypothetical protein
MFRGETTGGGLCGKEMIGRCSPAAAAPFLPNFFVCKKDARARRTADNLKWRNVSSPKIVRALQNGSSTEDETMTDELRDHLLCIISDAIERAEDHLSWLARNPQGPDRAAQLADTPAVDRLSK